MHPSRQTWRTCQRELPAETLGTLKFAGAWDRCHRRRLVQPASKLSSSPPPPRSVFFKGQELRTEAGLLILFAFSSVAAATGGHRQYFCPLEFTNFPTATPCAARNCNGRSGVCRSYSGEAKSLSALEFVCRQRGCSVWCISLTNTAVYVIFNGAELRILLVSTGQKLIR